MAAQTTNSIHHWKSLYLVLEFSRLCKSFERDFHVNIEHLIWNSISPRDNLIMLLVDSIAFLMNGASFTNDNLNTFLHAQLKEIGWIVLGEQPLGDMGKI